MPGIFNIIWRFLTLISQLGHFKLFLISQLILNLILPFFTSLDNFKIQQPIVIFSTTQIHFKLYFAIFKIYYLIFQIYFCWILSLITSLAHFIFMCCLGYTLRKQDQRSPHTQRELEATKKTVRVYEARAKHIFSYITKENAFWVDQQISSLGSIYTTKSL